jgi:protein-S-isoprenylcysteine O-methyltransferase Ste14
MIRIGNFFFRFRNALFPLVFILLVLPGPEIFHYNVIAIALGLTIAFAGQFLRAITIGLVYIVRGGRNRQVYAKGLVQTGMFAHCRNPLYVGNLLINLGVGVAANSVLFLAIGMPFLIFAYCAIIAAEENYLHDKFGQEFEDYCKRVPRWFPIFSGMLQTAQSMEFKWRRLIVKEYGSTFSWMAGVCAVLIKNRWLEVRTFSDLQIHCLIGTAVLVTLAFAIARYLKKSGTLVAD